MTPIAILELLTTERPNLVASGQSASLDPHAVVRAEDLPAVARYLRDDPRTALDLLLDISGVDYLETEPKKVDRAGFEPHLEVVYHFASFRLGHRFTLKVILPRWRDDRVGELPQVPSLTALYASADWHEREVYDLFGVEFVGHPGLERILLAEDWEGHPLRKDYEFPLEYNGIRGR